MEDELIFLDELVSLIKQKKELSPLDDDFVKEVVRSSSFTVEKNYDSFDQFKRSKLCKEIVSSVRKRLRDIYGLFLEKPLSTKHIDRLESIEATSLLSLHKSTLERAPYYPSLYPLLLEKLHEMGLKKDYVLADIACGYNPLAVQFLPVRPKEYFACDLSSKDMAAIDYFFKKFGVKGGAEAYDVLGTRFEEFFSGKKFDVCFLFKALDPFEQVKRHASKRLLSSLPTEFFVVSFSLFSIGGKTPIPASKRSWFEKFCQKQSWEFQTLQIPNELFYLIKTGK
ncbi:MAG: hypothetical protein KC535_00180 [Nanoarchaeota archaeon]|nr:hypothetical protein [Nanoarchaeota archaeon]